MNSSAEYKIAIIIPTLNEERHIEECLESVYAQTFPTAEMDVMVVDGGSTDRTEEIVRQLMLKWTNLRFIHNPKRIQSCAFNLGVAMSQAPIVIRMDAHAQYDREYVERCYRHLLADDTIGNVGGRCKIKPADTSLMAQANAILNRSRFGIGGSDFRVADEAKESDTVPFGAFRREVIEKVGGMREDLPRGEDNEYNSRIARAGYRIWFDPKIISSYYARPTLRTSTRQMYLNGESIAWLWRIDRSSLGLRHLVPLLFVLSIPCTLGATLVLYSVVAILATIHLCMDEGWRYFVPLLLLFPAIHLSYGAGTIVGFVSKSNR